MAYIKQRAKSDGTFSHTVMWRGPEDQDGKRKQESEVFDDEKAAERFRDLVNGHGQRWPPGWVRGHGFVKDVREPDELFEPFALHYVDQLTGVQGDTKAEYRKLVHQKLSPWFRNYSMREGEGGLTSDLIRTWVNDLEAGRPAPHDAEGSRRRKLSPKTIRNVHGLLSGICQSAVERNPPLRTKNPCAGTRLPRKDDGVEDEMVFLERDEWALLRTHLVDQDARELADTLAETGARWGEITALQPRDLVRRNGRPAIRIQRAWKRDEDGAAYLGAPKTVKARRTLVITSNLDQMLRRRAKGITPDDLLFQGPKGGRWDTWTFRSLRWHPAIEGARTEGLTKAPRVHDLRHSHASWLIAAKVPLPAIQGRLGHESITTTVDRYGHLLDALDDEVVAAVDWAMNPNAPLRAPALAA
ncbi:tyrosine-type recombinase/integrase [Streptomyces sp. NPDC059142]|uniref:tyrosine-type recombinase/integrase n=1 Tax=Streptomyces sp. NPDC059142 TaxID=3346739 RepID=UPI0036B4DE5D